MSVETPEFESWDEFNEYVESASSEELHALAIKHAQCWATLSFCDEDQMLWDEAEDWGELVFTRVLEAPHVSLETLQLALETGSENSWHRAFLSSTIMSSPAVTEKILLQIPVDDMIDDVDTAEQMYFHPKASIEVLLYALNEYPNNVIEALIFETERDMSIDERNNNRAKRDELRKSLLQKFKAKWEEVSMGGRKPTQEEQEEFDEFLELSAIDHNS
jgi:hypothetical protein